MRIVSRVYDLVRSRRLAAVLLAALAAWSGLATLVPQKGSTGGRTLQGAGDWLVRALGLDHAFSSPVFIGLAAALFVSTVACSLERTAAAVRLWRRADRPEAHARRLGARCDFVVEAADPAEAVQTASAALREAGLRVRTASSEVVLATSSRLGVWGSPAFHWLLAVLIVVIAAGQLTRAEGLMGVPVGGARLDTRASYGIVSEGPLHRGFTMLTVAVPSLELTHVVDGIDRGPTPYVELYDGPERLESGFVYPNHPLRYKSLIVHSNDIGLAVKLISPDGTETDALLDFDEARCVATSTLEAAGPGGVTALHLSIPLETVGGRCVRALPREPRIEWTATGPAGRRSGSVRPGERFEPVPGFAIAVARVGYYARLSVADDWSVYPMYAVFVLAVLALAVALFAPYREAAALVQKGPEGATVRIGARHARRDPSFQQRVRASVERAFSASCESCERRSRDDD
ncbi:cytochrome c biogenesis protein ResB [Coriobacteriia bacterium Es71-Z0120]|uniref:cytochrome c biogenesis protein ResB n=1 Tax=Parvivirga hydrogeniphila TaxID=2939460 RepID=UPI002260D9B0|nr:cytochrome c biogenesis protein ResB [Parvivirga hydrogeniphila]MCL4079329.1 cytochrome c biogenesis protein ResB [Parvivirga hydrogeniphila]